jgi:alpha-galactosidase
MFVDWGVDLVTYDACQIDEPGVVKEELVHKNSLAIRQREKHPIILNIVVLTSPWRWAPLLAVNMWRIAPDARDTYENMMQIADQDASLGSFATSEGWNDPDMLQVGHNGMTVDEYRTHMTLWVMLSAPLIASADLLRIRSSDLEILTNRDAIAINQDLEAQQAAKIQQGDVDVWRKSLSKGWAIAVVNRSDQPVQHAVNPNDLGIIASQAFEVWTKQTVALPYTATIAAHSCVLLRTM